MKRFLSLLLLITILCSLYPAAIIAYAGISDVIFVVSNVTLDEYDCPAPILTYHDTDEGGYITCTYRPDKVNRFLSSANTKSMPDAPKSWTTHISIDYRIDDGKWCSELGYLDSASSKMLNLEHVYNTPINEAVMFIFADIRQYNPIDDINEVYKDVITQGKNTIDLSKHKIEARFNVTIELNGDCLSLYTSPCAVLGQYANDNSEEPSLPITLPTPQIKESIANPDKRFISYQLLEDSQINELLAANHNIQIKAKYIINDKSSKTQTIKITNDIYYAIAVAENFSKENKITLQIAYYDANTNITSEWNVCDVSIIDEAPPEFIMPPLQGDNAENSTQIQTEHKCGLCGKCATQPLNICLWMWGCMSVAAIAIVACIISTIIDIRKKKA